MWKIYIRKANVWLNFIERQYTINLTVFTLVEERWRKGLLPKTGQFRSVKLEYQPDAFLKLLLKKPLDSQGHWSVAVDGRRATQHPGFPLALSMSPLFGRYEKKAQMINWTNKELKRWLCCCMYRIIFVHFSPHGCQWDYIHILTPIWGAHMRGAALWNRRRRSAAVEFVHLSEGE